MIVRHISLDVLNLTVFTVTVNIFMIADYIKILQQNKIYYLKTHYNLRTLISRKIILKFSFMASKFKIHG